MSFVADHLIGRPGLTRRVFEAGGVVFRRPPRGDEYRVLCPFHDDHDPSLDVNLEKALYVCRACGAGGDAVEFFARQTGCTVDVAILELRNRFGIGRNGGPPKRIKSWQIRDPKGTLVATHHFLGYDPKGKKIFSWEPLSLKTAEIPLYASEKLAISDPGATVIVAEGEKPADALLSHGFVAVGSVTGAGGTPGPQVLEVLNDRDVVLMPDNDEPGRRHMERIAARLKEVARIVRMLSWGDHEGDDAFDFFARGGTEEQFDRMLADALEWNPTIEPTVPGADWTSRGDGAQVEVRRLSEVATKAQDWLWKPRFPIGALTMIDGDPEKAKSTILLDLAARGSRGREFPDGQKPEAPFRTVILSAEDPVETVIRPRFDTFGGDPNMVWVVGSIRRQKDAEPQLLDLTGDLPALEAEIRKVNPLLVIVDPITAYLGDVDSFKDSAVRRALGPLATMAARVPFALAVVRHLNKNVSYSDVLYRGGGSIGFIAAARSGLMAVADPDDESRLLLAHYKCNLARKAPTLAYRITSSTCNSDLPQVEWLGIDPRSARQLHEAGKETTEDKSARGDARHLLRDILADGELEAEVVAEEAKRAGCAIKTLQRAAGDLKVKKRKVGFRPSVWYWSLP